VSPQSNSVQLTSALQLPGSPLTVMAFKQPQQRSQESTAQSHQQHQANWKGTSWAQSAVRKWNDTGKKCVRVAVQPQYQFLVIGLLQFLTGQFPILGKFMSAVAKSTGGFKSVLHKVLTVQACQLLWMGCQCLNNTRKECKKSAITNQVIASAANMIDWRQCLKFGSEWHKTTLQGAYAVWQSRGSTVPVCPQNQWMRMKSGQPMLPSDVYWASKDITTVRVLQLEVECRLTEYHEQSRHHDAGVEQFAEDKLKCIRQADELYQQFKHEYATFMEQSTDDQKTKLLQLASRLDYIDRSMYSSTKK